MFGLELAVKNICFFSLAAVSIREEVIVRAETTAGSAASNARIFFSFSIGLSIGLLGLWSLLFLSFLFFSFLRTVSPIGVPGFIYSGSNRIPGKERRFGYIWAGLCFSSIDIRLDVYCNDNLCFPELFPKNREMIYFP